MGILEIPKQMDFADHTPSGSVPRRMRPKSWSKIACSTSRIPRSRPRYCRSYRVQRVVCTGSLTNGTSAQPNFPFYLTTSNPESKPWATLSSSSSLNRLTSILSYRLLQATQNLRRHLFHAHALITVTARPPGDLRFRQGGFELALPTQTGTVRIRAVGGGIASRY